MQASKTTSILLYIQWLVIKGQNPQLIKSSHEISVVNAHFEWVKASNANLQNKKNTFCGCKDKKILYSTDK